MPKAIKGDKKHKKEGTMFFKNLMLVIVVAVAIIGLMGCAAQKIQKVESAQFVPVNLDEALIGKWSGIWDSGREAQLVIKEISADRRKVKLLYGFSGAVVDPIVKSGEREIIADLTEKPYPEIRWGDTRKDFEFIFKGGKILGIRRDGSMINRITMEKQ